MKWLVGRTWASHRVFSLAVHDNNNLSGVTIERTLSQCFSIFTVSCLFLFIPSLSPHNLHIRKALQHFTATSSGQGDCTNQILAVHERLAPTPRLPHATHQHQTHHLLLSYAHPLSARRLLRKNASRSILNPAIHNQQPSKTPSLLSFRTSSRAQTPQTNPPPPRPLTPTTNTLRHGTRPSRSNIRSIPTPPLYLRCSGHRRL